QLSIYRRTMAEVTRSGGTMGAGSQPPEGHDQSRQRSAVGANEKAYSLSLGQGKTSHDLLFEQASRSHLVQRATELREHSWNAIDGRDQYRCRSLRLYSDPCLLLPGGRPLA